MIPFLVLGFALSLYRLRKNGPGPAGGWVPRRLREPVNRFYRENGWQEPYDDEGNRRSNWPFF